MKILSAELEIVGIGPYSPSKPLMPEERNPGKRNETAEQVEIRRWKERIHHFDGPDVDETQVFAPQISIKKALDAAAALTKRKIKGAGNQTYGQQFVAGVSVPDVLPLFSSKQIDSASQKALPILVRDVKPQAIYCSATGDRRGLGARVFRTYGLIRDWKSWFTVQIYNASITEEIFADYLEEAGMLIGIGRWRPENGGMNGRFRVTNCNWVYTELKRSI